MAEEKTILLTQEAYKTLKEELHWRETTVREEITEKIAAARAEGDLSENGGYHAAKDAQGKNEGRINELIVKLRSAKILHAPEAGTVGNGSLVTIELAGRQKQYVLGSREISVATEYEVISPESPIGDAISGHHTGETVEYKAPNGRVISVTIVDARPLE